MDSYFLLSQTDFISVGCHRINGVLTMTSIHYENLPMQYTEFFSYVKKENVQ